MASDEPSLLLERRGAVAYLTFNRPAVLNALDHTMVEIFGALAREVAEDAGVRAVVLRGAGRAFMAGGDIGSFQRAGADAPAVVGRLIEPFHAVLHTLADMPKPFLTSVHGAVAGAGVSLMLAGDLTIAADSLQISLAYTRLGTNADGGASWSLPRIVGLRKAMEIALLNEPVGADEALRLSLVNKVVPAASLEAETEALAQKLADGPTLAFASMKRLLRVSFDNDLQTQLDAEAKGFIACADTADFREGVDAFMGKRRPHFTGR
jgi:2-(1,2-epoxy-1,2-dihydrophenyl)acetyl-CoA isomerase